MVKLEDKRLTDETAEVVRRSHARAIQEIQAAVEPSTHIVQNVSLKNGVPTTVGHSLGRTPKVVKVGVPRGAVSAGFITEDAKSDRTKSVRLTATGYGATIAVDLELA